MVVFALFENVVLMIINIIFSVYPLTSTPLSGSMCGTSLQKSFVREALNYIYRLLIFGGTQFMFLAPNFDSSELRLLPTFRISMPNATDAA